MVFFWFISIVEVNRIPSFINQCICLILYELDYVKNRSVSQSVKSDQLISGTARNVSISVMSSLIVWPSAYFTCSKYRNVCPLYLVVFRLNASVELNLLTF
jgi:TRAP-type mannitol/chloroaromatic compound transport system permease large subunit